MAITGDSPTCFVVMGFGKKTDFETGRTLDLDSSYHHLIKPAVEAAQVRCIRADEIVHSGMIDVPMYEQLLKADVVIADLSTSNKNAFYELGIRHALRPFTTLVIAEDGIKTFPFDVNHVVVRPYHHLGEDIGFGEVQRFGVLLTQAIREMVTRPSPKVDSPIYSLLHGLKPPSFEAAARGISLSMADGEISLSAPASPSRGGAEPPKTHSAMISQVDKAQERGDFALAKGLLTGIRIAMIEEAPSRPVDPSIVQRLALVTYKSKSPSELQALQEARSVLLELQPQTSNDPETLGLWGAIHKRLWTLSQQAGDLDEAVRSYQRGFFLRNDYYNGINFAYMLNLRAAHAASRAEAIADFVSARRVRREVVPICESWLAKDSESAPSGAVDSKRATARYWVLATLGEAHRGLGGKAALAESEKWLQEAYAAAPENWMPDSTRAQIAALDGLLADSPLRDLAEGGV